MFSLRCESQENKLEANHYLIKAFLHCPTLISFKKVNYLICCDERILDLYFLFYIPKANFIKNLLKCFFAAYSEQKTFTFSLKIWSKIQNWFLLIANFEEYNQPRKLNVNR